MKHLNQLLYRRTVSILIVLLLVGVGGAFGSTWQLSANLLKTQALESSRFYARTLQASRTLYSEAVVNKLKESEAFDSMDGIEITHDYQNKDAAIPIPATFLLELGDRLTDDSVGMWVRLYSDHPFPGRDRMEQDDFEKAALAYLQDNPDGYFMRQEKLKGRPVFRYAQADVMQASCVDCHNRHPKSPKTDWKVNDVRGVLEITTSVENFVSEAKAGLRNIFLALALLSGLGMAGIALAVSRFRREAREMHRRVQQRTESIRRVNQCLQEERKKTDRLLLNVLPEPIAQQLKNGDSDIAESFSEVTVLFADIVNFTQLAESTPPTQVVKLLNRIFSAFDELTEKYGLEKIKTIGDAYMVVGGLPIPRHDHAEAIAAMATEMHHIIQAVNAELGTHLSIRIGIHTGSVVAGVIGTKKFIYDLWGDTVNLASRMESHGIPGATQVSDSTYQILNYRYEFEQRAPIDIKGKGTMVTYLLKCAIHQEAPNS